MKKTKIVLIGIIFIVLGFLNIAGAKQVAYSFGGHDIGKAEKSQGKIKVRTLCKNAIDMTEYDIDVRDTIPQNEDDQFSSSDGKYLVFHGAESPKAPWRYFLIDIKKCRVVRELEAQYENKEYSVAFSPDSKKMFIRWLIINIDSPSGIVTKEYSGPDFTNEKILKNMPQFGRYGAAEGSDNFWGYDYQFTQDGKFLLTDYPIKSVWTINIYDISKDRIIASFPDSRVLFPNEKVYREDNMPKITEGYLLFNFATPHGTEMVIFNYNTKKVVSEIISAERGLGSFSANGTKIIFSTFPNKTTWKRNVIIYNRRTGSLLGQTVLEERDDIVDVSPHATKLIYKERGIRKTIGLRKRTMASLSLASQNVSKITDAEYRQYLDASNTLKKADNELNSSYKELMPVLQPCERQILILSQREWIKTRDMDSFKAAPKGSTAYITDLAKITNDRAAELKNRIHNAVNPFAGILQDKLSDAIYKNDLTRAKALIAKGADVNGKDSWGRPPIVVAAMYRGNPEIARLLLEKGANVNSKDLKNRTALIWALFEFKPNVAFARLLLDRGADAAAVDDDGYTALMGAAQAGDLDITELLIKKGAPVNAKVSKHGPWQEPNATNGHTALMGAVQNRHKDEAKLLIDNGADVKATDHDDYTALMGAAANGYADLVDLMIKKGADVNAKNKYGWTPLILAVINNFRNNHIDTVRLLLVRGANVNAKNNNGDTALDIANENGDEEVIQMLKAAGAK